MAVPKIRTTTPSARQLQYAGYKWDETKQKWLKGGTEWAGEEIEVPGQAATEEQYIQRAQEYPDIYKWEPAAIPEQKLPEQAILPEQIAAPAETTAPTAPIEETLPEGWSIDEQGVITTNENWKIERIWTGAIIYTDPEGKKYNREQLDARIARDKIIAESFSKIYPNNEVEEMRIWADAHPKEFYKSLSEYGDTPETRALLKAMKLSDEDIDLILNPDIVKEAGKAFGEAQGIGGKIVAGLGVAGAWMEKYLGRPWELAVLGYERVTAGFISTAVIGKEDPLFTEIDDTINKAFDKYGAGAIFSEDVSKAWENAWGKVSETVGAAQGMKTTIEFLNPIYLIPIGEGLGQAARFVSKVPVIGKTAEYTAAGVQAVEKGIAYPIAKPLEMAGKGVEKGLESIGKSLGDKAVKQMLKQSEHLEPIMEMPAFEQIISDELTDNWMKRALQAGAKIGPVKTGIEKALGWKVLTSRTAQEMEDYVGRAAVSHSAIVRRGENAAAAKVMELKSLVDNPVKAFKIDKDGFSSMMKSRALPSAMGDPNIGSVESIFTKPELYNWDGIENLYAYVSRYKEVQDAMFAFLGKYGVQPEHVLEDWIHRVVMEADQTGKRVKGGSKAVGAKPSYEKPRRFETWADGVEWFRNHPEYHAMYANNPEIMLADYMRQGFRKVADSEFEKYVGKFGVTVSERMAQRFPETVQQWQLRPITQRMGSPANVREQMADLGYIASAIKQAKRGSVPGSTLNAVQRRSPELADELSKAISLTPKERASALTALQKKVNEQITNLKPDWWKARAEYSHAKELASVPGLGEGYLPQPFAGGKIYKQEFIDAFTKFMGKEEGSKSLQAIGEVSSIMRMTKASLDFSAMAIQGLPSLGLAFAHSLTNPVEGVKMLGAWFNAFTHSVSVAFDPSTLYQYIAKNNKSIMQRVAAGGSTIGSDYIKAMESKLAEKLGKLAPYERTNLSFFTGTEIARDEFWKILSPKALKNGKGYELARSLDRMTGVYNSIAAGVPLTTRQLENAFVWFAPNYTRSCLAVLNDIFRGGMTGAMARKAIGGMVVSGAIMYSTVQYCMQQLEGKSDEDALESVLAGFGIKKDALTGEVEWKPDARFMTIQIGNTNFGFGGFWYSLLRLSGNIMKAIDKIAESDTVNFETILKGGGEEWMDNPILYWWRSRAAPVVGTGLELISGKDFFGNENFGYPTEGLESYIKYIITRFEPIWAEDAINQHIPWLAKKNEMPEGAAVIATPIAEIFGLRTFPNSSWVEFYDKAKEIINKLPVDLLEPYYTPDELKKIIEVQGKGKLTWEMLPTPLQQKLLLTYPELTEYYQTAQEDSARRNTPDWENWKAQGDEAKRIYYVTGNNLIMRFKRGEITAAELREQWSKAGEQYGTTLKAMEDTPAYAKVYEVLNKKQTEGGRYDFYMEHALAEYQSVVFGDYLDENGDFDFDKREKAINGFIEKYGTSTYELIKEMYADKKLTEGLDPTLVALSKDKEKLDEYWKLPYKTISSMTQEDFDNGKVPAEYVTLWQEYQTLKTDDERDAFKKAHPELAKDWREEYREKYPEYDAVLALWGYGGKLQSKEAYDILVKKSMDLELDIDKLDLGLPPRNLLDNYFEYNKISREFSGNSSEAKLYLIEHPEYQEWRIEKGLTSHPIEDNPKVLRLNIKWRDMDKKYEGISQATSEFYVEGEDAQQQARLKLLSSNPEYADDRRRRDAYDIEGFPESQVETYVDWYRTDRKGYEDDWYLMEHKEFYGAMVKTGQMKEKDFSKVPTKDVYNLYLQYESIQGEDKAARRLAFRQQHPDLDSWMLLTGKVSKPASEQTKKTTTTKKSTTTTTQPKKTVGEMMKEIEERVGFE